MALEKLPSAEVDKFFSDAATAELRKRGEDTILYQPDDGIFGVFDGVGMGWHPEVASRLAADTVGKYLASRQGSHPSDTWAGLVHQAFNNTRKAISANPECEHDSTTAVVVKILTQNSGKVLVWGSAGDSRIFHFSETGGVEGLNADQSTGNFLHNCLRGSNKKPSKVRDETGTRLLDPGDRIILCSDGITGDHPEQEIDPNDMAEAMTLPTAQEIADRFIALSKKDDDKSVVAIII